MSTNQKPTLKKENVTQVFDNRYVKVFDMQYVPGRHYMNATRRNADQLVALKSDEEFRTMLPDAVSIVLILCIDGEEPKLCLNSEFRYPTGQFLLSVPAGLMDPADAAANEPVIATAVRELGEETGIHLEDNDQISIINPLLFSTPGMTDESNALVQIVLNRKQMPGMTQNGAEGGECFDGFRLIEKDEAVQILRQGVDQDGIFYSVYTWAALMSFVSGLWK